MANLEDIVALLKRRGFIYPGSEIYGGLSGTWDYGPLGVILKRNVENLWWNFFVEKRTDMYGIDSALLMNPKVWEASGHVATFSDPLIEDLKTKKRYRLDHILEDNEIDPTGMSIEDMQEIITQKRILSPDGNQLGNAAKFNLMFKTHIGSVEDDKSIVYLRPETAQGMFVNFKNIMDSFYPDLPFGIAQVGKNFRNEISPRDFIFRSREFEIMELEYFIDPKDWEEEFEKWLKIQVEWYVKILKLDKNKLVQKEIGPEDRAHYSKRTVDFEYVFPFGTKEIGGFAYRGDFDLSNHQKMSGKSLEYRVKGTDKVFIPHVLEPTFGLDRNVLALIFEAYSEDEVNNEKRIFLRLDKEMAPYRVAISPLLKNKTELVEKAKEVFNQVKASIYNVVWDDNGNIGKRYRRQDEIGTPFCVTIDFETLDNDTVTLRDRDTTTQERIKISDLIEKIS